MLNAYAKSPVADKAIMAHKLLREMEQHPRLDCRPDVISYNSLLEACSNAFGRRSIKDRSIQIALEAFKTLLVSAKNRINNHTQVDEPIQNALLSPTSTTFANFAKVSRRLIASPEQKQSALRKTLQLCKDTGMLNHMVVQQVQTACRSETEWIETAGELAKFLAWKADFRKVSRDVPREWTCHARR